MKKETLSHLAGQGAMAAVAAMAATQGTLAVPGALVSQSESRIISLTLGTWGAPTTLIPRAPDDDPWDAWSHAPESLRAIIGKNHKNSKEPEKVILQALPKAHMFRQWKLTVRKSILSASVDPDATWLWLLEIGKDIATFGKLYHPGEYSRTLDTKLCVAVDNLVKDNDSLRNDIMIATETLAKKDMRTAGRQVLLIVNSLYKTSVDIGIVYDVEDVIAVTLHHNQMEHCLHRRDRVISGLAEPMPENTKKAFFCSKVRDCPAFLVEYLGWKRLSDDDPTKTLDTLRTAMKTTIEDPRREG